MIQSDLDGSLNLQVRNDDWETVLRVRILIEREISDYEIVETVNYVLSNGSQFEYILRRAGKNLKPLLDKDLLMFKFQAEEDLDYYEILIPSLGIDYSRSLTANNESAFFIIGAIGLELRIETKISNEKIERQYIFNSAANQNIFMARIDSDLNEFLSLNFGERISSINLQKC